MLSPEPRGGHEAARIYRGSRWRGGVAARGARAAAERCRRIGVSESRATIRSAHPDRSVSGGLAELGWTDGRNVAIEYRWAEGRTSAFEVAAELVARVDVIVAVGASRGRAGRPHGTFPIVFATAFDPIGERACRELARPGGNVTGLSFPVD